MNCFIDYIGLDHCNGESESGFYINDMSGMSIKRLDNISDAERKNFLGVWNRVQRRAVIELESRILNRFLGNWKASLSIDNQQFGYFDNGSVMDLGTSYKGVYLFYQPDSWTKTSIPYFEVYSSQAYTGAVFVVHDINTNSRLKTITVDLVQGYNKVSLDVELLQKAASPMRIFVGYDSSLISLFQSSANYSGGLHNDTRYEFGYVSAQDIEINEPFIYANVLAGSGSGISLTYSIGCSLEAFICSQKHLFKYAWAKLLCAEIYRETMDTDRVTFFTTFKADRAEQEMQNAMNDFNASISDVLDSINLDSEGVCFECNEQIQRVYGRP